MASNPLPAALAKLFAKAGHMITGLHDLEVTIGVKQNTEAVMAPALAASEGAESSYDDKKTRRKQSNAVVTAKDGLGKVFIVNSRKRLSKFFGEKASTEWEGAGWPAGTTSVPDSQDERFSLIMSLKNYFALHPEHESVDMDATSALALAAWTAINDARADLNTKVTNAGTAKAARDAAVANLRKRMTGLIEELITILAEDDPRWHMLN